MLVGDIVKTLNILPGEYCRKAET